jgi:hypothetical protein
MAKSTQGEPIQNGTPTTQNPASTTDVNVANLEQQMKDFEEYKSARLGELITKENKIEAEKEAHEKNVAEFEDKVKTFTESTMQQEKTFEVATEIDEVRKEGFIYAKRGVQENTFSKLEWDNMGDNKDGWVEDIAVPKEVAELKTI